MYRIKITHQPTNSQNNSHDSSLSVRALLCVFSSSELGVDQPRLVPKTEISAGKSYISIDPGVKDCATMIWLVVESTPLKNMKVNWDDYSQYMGR